MKKQILNLGKALSKAEQKNVTGGGFINRCKNEGDFCDWISAGGYGSGYCEYILGSNDLICLNK